MRISLALLTLFITAGISCASFSSARPPVPWPVARVSSFDELLPTTDDEKVLATWAEFGSSLRPGLAVNTAGPGFPTNSPIERLGDSDPALARAFALCRATVVLVGHAVSRKVIVNEKRTGLITVYRVKVERRIMPQRLPSEVTFGVWGGRAWISGVEYVVPGSELATVPLERGVPNLIFLGPHATGGFGLNRRVEPMNVDRIDLIGMRGTPAQAIQQVIATTNKCDGQGSVLLTELPLG